MVVSPHGSNSHRPIITKNSLSLLESSFQSLDAQEKSLQQKFSDKEALIQQDFGKWRREVLGENDTWNRDTAEKNKEEASSSSDERTKKSRKFSNNNKQSSQNHSQFMFPDSSGALMTQTTALPDEKVYIKGVEVSSLDFDDDFLEAVQRNQSRDGTRGGMASRSGTSHQRNRNFRSVTKVEDDASASQYRTYKDVPSNVSLSNALRYHRKELEQNRAYLMFERSSAVKRRGSTTTKRQKKKRNSIQSGAEGRSTRRSSLISSSSEQSQQSTRRRSKSLATNASSSVGKLNRIMQNRELYSRPLAGQESVDWSKRRLRSAKRGRPQALQTERGSSPKSKTPSMLFANPQHNYNDITLSHSHHGMPSTSPTKSSPLATMRASSPIRSPDKRGSVASQNSRSGSPISSVAAAKLMPKSGRTHIGSKKRKNRTQHRNIFQRLTHLNSEVLDRIDEDVSKRSTSLEMDLEFLLQQQQNHTSRTSRRVTAYDPNSMRHKLRNYYRFRIRLKHENDIRHLYYHIQFTDLESKHTHHEYNRKLNANNSIIWNPPKNTIFKPFESFRWIQQETDLKDRKIEIIVKASLGRLSPPDMDAIIDDEENIFSISYRGGVVHMCKEVINTNFSNFPVPNSKKYPTFSFKCENRTSQKGGRNKKRNSAYHLANVHSRSIIYRPEPPPTASKKDRLITSIPYSVAFSPFHEYSRYNPVSQRTRAEKRVPHAPSTRLDSSRVDVSSQNPYTALKRHPLFRSWNPPQTAPAPSNEPSASMIASQNAQQGSLRPITVPTMQATDLGFTEYEPQFDSHQETETETEEQNNEGSNVQMDRPPQRPRFLSSAGVVRRSSPPKRRKVGHIPEEFACVEGINKEIIRDLVTPPLLNLKDV